MAKSKEEGRLKELLYIIEKDQVDVIKKIDNLQKMYEEIVSVSRKIGLEDIRRLASLNLRRFGIGKQAIASLYKLPTPEEEKKSKKKKFFKKETAKDDDQVLGLSFFDEME